jgi:predicted PurR-regulated permease PerM
MSPGGERGEEDQKEQDELRAPELVPAELRLRGVSVTAVTFRVMVVVVGVVLALGVLWQLQQLVLLTIVALIIAAAMHAPVAAMERRGVPRPLAILLAYAVLLGVFAAAAVVVAGPLVTQLQQLFDDLPEIASDLRAQFVEFVDGFAGEGQGEELVAWAEGAATGVDLQPILGVPMTLAGAAIDVFIVLILSAFFVYERDTARGFFLPLVPADRRESAHELSRSILRRLAAYVHGRFVVMVFIGLAMTATLMLLGIPFALPLGLFAFVVELIPMIGPWLALIPAVAVAFTESPEQAIALMVIWFVVQQIESYVLTPAIMGRFQHLPPSVVLLSVLAGFALFGVLGAIIGVPVVAVIAMIIQGVFVPAHRRSMGEPDDIPARPAGRQPPDQPPRGSRDESGRSTATRRPHD